MAATRDTLAWWALCSHPPTAEMTWNYTKWNESYCWSWWLHCLHLRAAPKTFGQQLENVQADLACWQKTQHFVAQKDVHFAAALAQCKHGVQNLKGLYRSFVNWFRFNYHYLKQIILNHKHFCRIENNMLFSRATSILIFCLTTALISGHLCPSRNGVPQI